MLGTYKDEELGQVVRETPGKEQGEIFAIVLVLLVLEIMYDSLFIYGILEVLGPTISLIYTCHGISNSGIND